MNLSFDVRAGILMRGGVLARTQQRNTKIVDITH